MLTPKGSLEVHEKAQSWDPTFSYTAYSVSSSQNFFFCKQRNIHLLHKIPVQIVFGGVKGLETSLDADQLLKVDDPALLFSHYLNTCPNQGSHTIRTEVRTD